MLLRKIIYWAPRVLVVLYALFISLFALDVFSEGYSITETIVALFMHMLPTLVVVFVLVIAWRWELIWGLMFILLAGAFLVFFGGRNDIEGYLIVAGPLFLVGVLFLINGYVTSNAGGNSQD